MIIIKEFNFIKAMNLYMRILDAHSYIENCRVLEIAENKKVLDFIYQWLEILKNDVHNQILACYYNYPGNIDIYDIEQITDELNSKNEALKSIFANIKYIPILPPSFTLKTMVDEIVQSSIPNEIEIPNVYFKNITEFNFTESKMITPDYNIDTHKTVEKMIAPNVLSMTVIYHNNPLMWPLIFHEYGHTVFSKIKKQKKYQHIYDNIRVYCVSNLIEIHQTKLTTIISETFSDLFAINYYGSNYFFAFYFHEILSSNTRKLLNLSDNDEFQIENHPPSAIRLKHMLEELNNKGYTKNDDVLQELLKYHSPYAETISTEMEKIPVKYIGLYKLIFNEVSNLFKGYGHKNEYQIDPNLINKLHTRLKDKLPIGTSYNKEKDLKYALTLATKKFDIEENNRTIDMIYSGWKYLISDLLMNFYKQSDYTNYLENSRIPPEEIKNKSIDNKILKFNKEYNFLTKNINYSIETSVIVSNYLEV